MSLYESGESTGEVSFKDILDGKDVSVVSKLSLEDLASIIVRGGWPASIEVESNAKFCMRDLKIYTSIYGEDITFYRDEKDFEIKPDAIPSTLDGGLRKSLM